MELSRKSFAFRVAYAFHESREIPPDTNLCQFFWRFSGMLLFIPIVYLAMCVWIAFKALFLVFSSSIIGFFFAARTTIHVFEPDEKDNDILVPYSKWPTICGKRIWPIWLIVPIPLLIYWNVLLDAISFCEEKSSAYMATIAHSGHVALYAATAIVVILLIATIVTKSETIGLVGHYLAAKKQRVCPKIDFTD